MCSRGIYSVCRFYWVEICWFEGILDLFSLKPTENWSVIWFIHGFAEKSGPKTVGVPLWNNRCQWSETFQIWLMACRSDFLHGILNMIKCKINTTVWLTICLLQLLVFDRWLQLSMEAFPKLCFLLRIRNCNYWLCTGIALQVDSNYRNINYVFSMLWIKVAATVRNDRFFNWAQLSIFIQHLNSGFPFSYRTNINLNARIVGYWTSTWGLWFSCGSSVLPWRTDPSIMIFSSLE